MKKIAIVVIVVLLTLNQANLNAKSSGEIAASAQIFKIAHGAHIRPSLEYGKEVQAFNNIMQKDIAVLMYFLPWNPSGQNGLYFDPYLLNKMTEVFGNNKPAIMLTWAPFDGKRPGCDKDYSGAIPINDIANGKCDEYIRGFAQALKARSERFLLRFAHEMNISDIPWWPGHIGQDASAYIQMYRHVHDVFSSQNVLNVEWVWSPNYDSYPRVSWNHRNLYYPGDAYVDWIGLSGLNWNNYLNIPWMTFLDLYDNVDTDYVLKDLTCRYPKPQILAEFGSVDGSGDPQTKASWISDAYNRIPQNPFVRSVVWFNDYAGANPSLADFRVTTNSGSTGNPNQTTVLPLPIGSGKWTNAYKQAISNSVYNSSLPTLKEATPPSTYCGSGEPSFNATPSAIVISNTQEANLKIIGMLYNQNQVLTVRLPTGSALSGTFSSSILTPPWGETLLTIEPSSYTPPGIYSIVVEGNGIDLLTFQLDVRGGVASIYLPYVNK